VSTDGTSNAADAAAIEAASADAAAVIGIFGDPRGLGRGVRALGALAAGAVAGVGVVRPMAGVAALAQQVAGAGPRSPWVRRDRLDRLTDALGAESLVPTDVVLATAHRSLPGPPDEPAVSWPDPPWRPAVAETGAGVAGAAIAGVIGAPGARATALSHGALLPDASDDALLLSTVARSTQRHLVNRIVDALIRLGGGTTGVLGGDGRLVAARDAWGVRTLFLGHDDGVSVVASSRSAVEAAGVRVIRELEPGEVVVIDRGGLAALRPLPDRATAACGLGWLLTGPRAAATAQRRLAVGLAREAPAVGVVFPSSEGSQVAAAAWADAQGARLEPGGLGAVGLPEVLRGEPAVVVALPDVRWSVLTLQVRALRRAGAPEVHVRLIGPPPARPCAYGVVLGHVASEPEGLAARVDADSARWLSRESYADVVGGVNGGVCTGCLGGAWPVPPDPGADQLSLFQDSAGPA
jgi:amidophosphoribosyltransferase